MAKKFLEAILDKAKKLISAYNESVEQEERTSLAKVKEIGEDGTVIRISLLGLFRDMDKQEIQKEIEAFYALPEYPFVSVFDTEYFKTHVHKEWYALVEFDILVAAERRLARKVIHDRCHKIVESEPGVVAFNVKLV